MPPLLLADCKLPLPGDLLPPRDLGNGALRGDGEAVALLTAKDADALILTMLGEIGESSRILFYSKSLLTALEITFFMFCSLILKVRHSTQKLLPPPHLRGPTLLHAHLRATRVPQ